MSLRQTLQAIGVAEYDHRGDREQQSSSCYMTSRESCAGSCQVTTWSRLAKDFRPDGLPRSIPKSSTCLSSPHWPHHFRSGSSRRFT
jgi:hypothetical protein